MGQQLRKGTQFPLRPATSTVDADEAFTVIADPGAVDWTASGTRFDVALGDHLMDDDGWISVGGSSNLSLKSGIYEIEFSPVLTNGDTAVHTALIAITHTAGATVLAESGAVVVPASGSVAPVLRAIFEHNSMTSLSVNLRAVQNEASGTDISIANGSQVARVTRIGNEGEA